MIAPTESPAVAKPRRRPVAKSSRSADEKPMKIGLHLSPESWRRLGVTSTMENKTQSQIVDDLIRQHLRKYVVQVRSTRPEDSASVPEEVSAA
jgi:hypothetical protein